MDGGGKKIAFVATSMTKPTELFVANTDGTGERKLTRFNDALNQEVAWSDAERFTYKSVGGLEIEGWLMKPYGYQPGKKYPLVLYIHGGPHCAYGEGWFDEFQNLAGAGFWVLFTNPRGSSGYGADFTYSTRGRWFAEDYEDLMKAVDLAAKRAGRRLDPHGRHRRFVRRRHDGLDHGQDEPVQGGAGRPHDQQLLELVRLERRAGSHGVRVLRQAVGQPRDVRLALADPATSGR